MNVIAGLGVYGAILREAGEALHCPRRATCDSVGEACNSDLVARCIAWAGMSEVPATRCSTSVRGRHGLVAPGTDQMFKKWFDCYRSQRLLPPHCVMGLAEQAQARSER